MSDYILKEFRYQRHEGPAAMLPAYYVTLGRKAVDDQGVEHLALTPPLSPEEAKALGFDLPEVFADLNATMMSDNAALKLENGNLRQTVEGLLRQVAELKAAAEPSA